MADLSSIYAGIGLGEGLGSLPQSFAQGQAQGLNMANALTQRQMMLEQIKRSQELADLSSDLFDAKEEIFSTKKQPKPKQMPSTGMATPYTASDLSSQGMGSSGGYALNPMSNLYEYDDENKYLVSPKDSDASSTGFISILGGNDSIKGNNVGNLRVGTWTTPSGAKGKAGQIATFDTLEEGEKAHHNLWASDAYNKKPISQTIASMYNPSTAKGNSPQINKNYIKYIKDKTGIDIENKTYNELTPREQAMFRAAQADFEHGTGGTFLESVLAKTKTQPEPIDASAMSSLPQSGMGSYLPEEPKFAMSPPPVATPMPNAPSYKYDPLAPFDPRSVTAPPAVIAALMNPKPSASPAAAVATPMASATPTATAPTPVTPAATTPVVAAPTNVASMPTPPAALSAEEIPQQPPSVAGGMSFGEPLPSGPNAGSDEGTQPASDETGTTIPALSNYRNKIIAYQRKAMELYALTRDPQYSNMAKEAEGNLLQAFQYNATKAFHSGNSEALSEAMSAMYGGDAPVIKLGKLDDGQYGANLYDHKGNKIMELHASQIYNLGNPAMLAQMEQAYQVTANRLYYQNQAKVDAATLRANAANNKTLLENTEYWGYRPDLKDPAGNPIPTALTTLEDINAWKSQYGENSVARNAKGALTSAKIVTEELKSSPWQRDGKPTTPEENSKINQIIKKASAAGKTWSEIEVLLKGAGIHYKGKPLHPNTKIKTIEISDDGQIKEITTEQ
jgi:hypothetical protein